MSTLHLSCPSGIAGNLFATALTVVGVPYDTLASLPQRLDLPGAFTVQHDGFVLDGVWDETVDPTVVGGGTASMGEMLRDMLGGWVGDVAARIVETRWRYDLRQEVFGEAWCDTLFDASAAAVGLDWLGRPDVVLHGPLPRQAAHPIAVNVLADWYWTRTRVGFELVTPTGASIMSAVASQTLVAFDDRRGVAVEGVFGRRHGLRPLLVRVEQEAGARAAA